MINLYSDTQTRPTDAMRRAMAAAEVGDEQRRQDPTVERLCERVAELLGKEAALYLPSGAMCNAIAVKVHTQPGDAVLLERACHILRAECGGIGLLSGCVTEALDGKRGQFSADYLRERVEHLQLGVYSPPPRLVCVEQTHNFAGGTVWPTDELHAVAHAARELGLKSHVDGARLMNACVAIGEDAATMIAPFDSVWIDFTKGLGAPIGAALAGSAEFIQKARRYKHMFGGAMRQAGIVAAGALYALDHNVDRLADDHANAGVLADAIDAADGLELIHGRPQTNIVFFRVTKPGLTAADYAAKLRERGVEVSVLHGSLRAVTHLDVTREQCEQAGHAMQTI